MEEKVPTPPKEKRKFFGLDGKPVDELPEYKMEDDPTWSLDKLHRYWPEPISIALQGIVTPKVPAPPQLPREATAVEKAKLLVKAYNSVVEYKTGKRSFSFAKGDITRSKFFKTLVATAEALLTEKISPIQWVLFSIHTWQHDEKHTDMPSISYVFTPSRVKKLLDLYYEYSDEASYGRCVYPDALMHAILVYEKLWRKFRVVRSQEETDTILNSTVPGNTWAILLYRAKRVCDEVQKDLKQKAEDYVFIWDPKAPAMKAYQRKDYGAFHV